MLCVIGIIRVLVVLDRQFTSHGGQGGKVTEALVVAKVGSDYGGHRSAKSHDDERAYN
jgi:hypothetical protein